MSWPIDVTNLLLLTGAGVLASYTDFRSRKVLNRHLALLFLIGLALDALLLMLFSSASSRIYFFALWPNVVGGLLIACLLYVARIWPAGDAKLYALLVFLMPPWIRDRHSDFFWAFSILVDTFLVAYAWVACDSLIRWGRTKLGAAKPAGRRHLWRPNWLWYRLNGKALAVRTVFVLASIPLGVSLAGRLLPKDFYARNLPVVEFILFLVLILLLRLIRRDAIFGAIVALEVVAFAVPVALPTAQVRIGIPTLPLAAVAVLLVAVQYLANKYDLEQISLERLTPGRVLSTGSLVFVLGKVRGLQLVPGRRLSPGEVAKIVNCKAVAKGTATIEVQRRMVFAPFLFAGVVVQIALGALIHWAPL